MSKSLPYLKALAAALIWGTSFVASKIVLKEAQPLTLTWIRFGIGVAIIGASVGLRRQFAVPQKKEWLFFLGFGFLGITFHQWLQATGMVTSAASTTSWIVATTPVFFALLAWPVLRERIGWSAAIGILLAAGGVLVVVSKGQLQTLSLKGFGAPGDFLILLSSINWAVFSIFSRRGLKDHPAARMIFWLMLCGWLFTGILFLAGPGPADLGSLTPKGWMAAVYLGIFCSGVAYILWYDALEALSATGAGVFLYLEPLATLIAAYFLLGEDITWASIAGGAAILVGVYLVNRK
jgi:drug/metabolite transporter (DMT)-like permease